MCAMLVGGARCACAFRKLRFGDVVYLHAFHAFHAFSAFPVEVHLVLCLLLPCRVRCIANAQGSVLDWHARHSEAVPKKIGTCLRRAWCMSGTLCACVVCCWLLSRCVTSGVVGSFHVLAPVMCSCLFFVVGVRILRIGCARYCEWPLGVR